MFNGEQVVSRINDIIHQKKIVKGKMLDQLGCGVNTLSFLKQGKEVSYITVAKIADYLDCSVDYLLGRTENPAICNNSISTGDITGNNNANMSINNDKPAKTDDTQELVDLIQSLNLVQRARVVVYIDNLRKEEESGIKEYYIK